MSTRAALRGRIATAARPAAAARRWARGSGERPMVSFSFPGVLGYPARKVLASCGPSALTTSRGGPRLGSAQPDMGHLWCNLRRTLPYGSDDVQGAYCRLSLMVPTFARRVFR